MKLFDMESGKELVPVIKTMEDILVVTYPPQGIKRVILISDNGRVCEYVERESEWKDEC